MVAIWEYRIVLPFTVEEYKIAQLYMVAKFSASESSGDDGDGVEVLKNEPFEDGDRRGQYTHKLYHVASKLPTWLVSLLPQKALILEEEAWNSYPHCTTVLMCPFFNKFRLILETIHLPDRGTTENPLGLDPKTLKKRQVEFIDIGTDPVENYSEEEDPSKFRSRRTGRGPLTEGWSRKCEPVMCAYKCVTVDFPYWGFGTRIEKYISQNAQRRVLLEGHRKCFCWMDEWHGLTMEDVRRMELETAEAIAKARQLALRRFAVVDEEGCSESLHGLAESEFGPLSIDLKQLGTPGEQPLTPRRGLVGSKSSSRANTPRGVTNSPSLLRRPSLVGPSVAVGITTLSASDVDDFTLGGSSPPPPPSKLSSLTSQTLRNLESELDKDVALSDSEQQHMRRSGSCESFTSTHSNSGILLAHPLEDSPDVAQCVDVLDRAINWTKQRAKVSSGNKASGRIAPVDSNSSVEHCVGVLATALSVVQKRPKTKN